VDSTADKYALRNDSYNSWSNLLRRSHLDELPQLWSVAKGDMSIVGPRPEMPSLSSKYPVDFVKVRTSVRPGITGAWQISEALAGLIYEAPEYDREYVASASPKLDIWILWRTVRGIFGGDPINLTELKARTRG
jgi:lipopolysaccharide/colanic/teichoic acid biosynthesis glycosyltransferase